MVCLYTRSHKRQALNTTVYKYRFFTFFYFYWTKDQSTKWYVKSEMVQKLEHIHIQNL